MPPRPLPLLCALALLGCSSPTPSPFAPASQRVAVELGSAPSTGPADAKVVLVEFADFQCPYCGQEAPVVKQVLAAYPTQLRLVFKQFPLASLHPFAELAAEASLAADAQGKFWDYHDMLYSRQPALARSNLDAYAAQLGLELTAFDAALDGGTYAPAVAADVAQGRALGVPGTPAFFVNGRLGAGAIPLDQLEAVIAEEL